MNPLWTTWRLALSAACLLALLALANPSWGGDKDKGKTTIGEDKGKTAIGDKDKSKTVNGEDKEKPKEMAKPFDQVTWDVAELDKNFKMLKVEGKLNEQKFYQIRWSLVARKKLTPQMLNEMLSKLEVRFYADNVIVGRYYLQPTNPEQTQRGLVQDEKMVVQLLLAPDMVERIRAEKPTRAAIVKAE